MIDSSRERLRRRVGWALALWSLLYALPHLYWAAGGVGGLDVLRPDVARLPQWRTINAVATAMLLATSVLGIVVVRPPLRPAWRAALFAILGLGCALATTHGLYGIGYRLLTAAGGIPVDGRAFDPATDGWVLWDLLLLEPWFLIEGLLLGAAGWSLARTAWGRRVWLWACTAGAILAAAAALARVKAF